MPTQMFEVVVHSPAEPKAVFDLLTDIPSWQVWGRPLVPRSIRERDGSPDPNGVGAVRKAGGPGFWVREEVVEFIPPVRYAYIVVRGVPVRRYRAVVELEPAEGGGTTIRWRAQLEQRVPGVARAIEAIITALAKRLARRA